MKHDMHNGLRQNGEGFYISRNAIKIGEAALTGMLYEASSSPAPGLVSPFSKGAHSDMDYFTFLRSSSSIAYAMYVCSQIGMNHKNNILRELRQVGMDAEKRMFRATDGVNTHRGLLFLAGVTCAAAGSCLRDHLSTERTNIAKECSNICRGIVESELESLPEEKVCSNGEKLFKKYGVTGIRGEVEKGLPSVLNVGLPIYEGAMKSGLQINRALVQSLIGLMTAAEDTTVINRCGIEGFNFMRETAKRALELGGMYTIEGETYIRDMEAKFSSMNISPGGAADLLAVTVMIHELENTEWE